MPFASVFERRWALASAVLILLPCAVVASVMAVRADRAVRSPKPNKGVNVVLVSLDTVAPPCPGGTSRQPATARPPS